MIYRNREGETPLDDLSGLKIKITNITRRRLDQAEEENIQLALLKYIDPTRIRDFNISFFNRLHKDMFGRVWKWAGEYRTTGTNIGSAPVHIIQDLIILQKDLEAREASLETAVWLHHRAVQIHPFPGGNGRWSRLLSDLWLQKYTGQTIRWPVGMNKESPVRQEYLDGLRAADVLDYMPLLELHKRFVE